MHDFSPVQLSLHPTQARGGYLAPHPGRCVGAATNPGSRVWKAEQEVHGSGGGGGV